MPEKNGSTYGLAVMQDPFFCTFLWLVVLLFTKNNQNSERNDIDNGFGEVG